MFSNNKFFKLWGMPLFLVLTTISGLLLAIMGTGVWHYFSWIALVIPLIVLVKFGGKFFKKASK